MTTAPITYVLTHSTSRPRQMHALARALSDRYSVDFAATYLESRREWALDWCDGPTEDEVRAAVTRLATGMPAVTSLRPRRAHTDLGEAAALLAWIDQAPDRAARLSIWQKREAFAAIRFPERAWAWRDRAEALLSIGSLDASVVGWLRARAWVDAVDELDRRAATLRTAGDARARDNSARA